MRFCSPKRLWLALLLLSVAAGGARGQWTMVAPNLAKVNNYNGDAMCYRDGIVWIVADALYMSTDTGITWISKKLPKAKFYYDIQFYNQTQGILTSDTLTWITSDAGTSWQQLSQTAATSVCFLNGVNDFTFGGGVTTDGGLSWSGSPQSGAYCVKYKNGTIYDFAASTFFFGSIITSTDFGSTWQQGNTGIDVDSWSLAIDSCDVNRIYLSHEDMAIATDQFSKIFLTTDRGDTWQTMVSQPRPFFSGSVAEGNFAIYCQTTSNGVFRSTDKGMTWSTIGGPSVGVDSRLIAALSDDLLLAVDSDGNVWRTDNSGGDSIQLPQIPSAQVHSESASAYMGQIDTLDLKVDVSSTFNIDSLWPFLSDIQASYTWDSTVVSYESYLPPSGWIVTSVTPLANEADIAIHNVSSTPSSPLDLGMAIFQSNNDQPATSWVLLPLLVLDAGCPSIALSVTDNEDNHWSVKTLGIQSGVTEVPVIAKDISIYPNPAEDELFVQNSNEFPVSIEMYDAIGREVLSATGASSSTTTIATQSLQDGVYFFRATGANGFSTSSKVVIVR
jgi:hypothetical protein